MMMLQHKEISKMRRSTQFYRQKIHKYRHQAKAATPTLDQSQDNQDVQASLHRSQVSSAAEDEQSYSEMFSDADQESSAAPSEQFNYSFSSDVPLKADHSSGVAEALEKTKSSSGNTPSVSLTLQTRSVVCRG